MQAQQESQFPHLDGHELAVRASMIRSGGCAVS
ncbi:MAG: hypothetical protein OJF51_002433 [Nitrospira sp.]|jgi:hypothetical protein|nr:MAG: hypothetical protein OJF51_002433 [Nitrospira sp.]